jgi:hypothetical protein
MEQPNKKMDNRKVIFTVLMAAAFASVIALYRIALPFVDDHSKLNLALIAALVFIVASYYMAVKGGIPPSPPKKIASDRENIPVPPEPELMSGKRKNPVNRPQAAVKGGIPPAPRKENP